MKTTMQTKVMLAAAIVLSLWLGAPAVQAAEPTKEQAIAHLKGLLTALEAKDYDKAATFFVVPPGATPEQLKEAMTALIEKREISAEGIEVLAAEGKWSKLADVAKPETERAASWAKRSGVNPTECWALMGAPGEAAFHFDGTSLKLIRCDDIGKLKKNQK
jgi:hypothetical protein